MTHLPEWKVISTETVQKGRFEIVYETVQFKPDYAGPYSYIRYRADGVCVLPVLPDGRVCLVRQYRRPVDAMEIEVPAGMIDRGEEPQEAARRELLEETGYSAARIEDCGYLFASPGSSTEKMYLFIAFCDDGGPAGQALDPSERIQLGDYSIEEVRQLISNGQIHHSATQVLFFRYMNLLSATTG